MTTKGGQEVDPLSAFVDTHPIGVRRDPEGRFVMKARSVKGGARQARPPACVRLS